MTTLLSRNSQRRLEHKENQAKFKKKNDQEASEPLGVMLEFYYIERGLLAKLRRLSLHLAPVTQFSFPETGLGLPTLPLSQRFALCEK